MGDRGGISPAVAPGGLNDDWDDNLSAAVADCCWFEYVFAPFAVPDTAVAEGWPVVFLR